MRECSSIHLEDYSILGWISYHAFKKVFKQCTNLLDLISDMIGIKGYAWIALPM